MTEALPIGNGYMGAMIFGGIEEEHIQFNEESLWSGGPGTGENYNYGNRVGAYKFLPDVRKLLSENKFDEAHKLANEKLTGIIHKENSNMSFGDYGAYQTFGDLYVKVKHQGEVTEYYRDLDISQAVANVKYKAGRVNYQRRFFANYPDRVLVFNFATDDLAGTDYQIYLRSPHKNKTKFFSDNNLFIIGALDDNGMEFEARLLVRIDDGKVEWKGKKIIVSGVKELTLFLTAATDYLLQYPHYKGNNYRAHNAKIIENIKHKSFDKLLSQHIDDYQALFKRVRFNLGVTDAINKPINQRLEDYHNGASDPQLEALYFQFGRYLLISSSRPGTLSANLQGKWNYLTDPPWACDYHTNINVQMNYWPAEVTNLSKCHLPLIHFIESLQEPGRVTAREHFNARGWTVNTMNNPYGFTAPG